MYPEYISTSKLYNGPTDRQQSGSPSYGAGPRTYLRLLYLPRTCGFGLGRSFMETRRERKREKEKEKEKRPREPEDDSELQRRRVLELLSEDQE